MAQKKLKRFAELKEFKNVLEYPEGMKGKWKDFFGNDNPLTLELACGKGEYALGLGRLYPERNFLGVDIKGNRIWKGARTALNEGLNNVAFLRTQIDKIEEYFSPGEVKEIWITFPDPQLRFSKIRKRLTHPKFLRKYKEVLSLGGSVHLKTDSPDLYYFTLEVLKFYSITLTEHCNDIYNQDVIAEELKIKTYYESLDIAGSQRVHYVQFNLNNAISPVDKDVEFKEFLTLNQ